MEINLTQIIIALISLFTMGLVIKTVIKKNQNKVKQKNIHAKGDVAGRDIKK
ncbi:MAG: hypothetical protein IPM32_09060 [Ignavibacteriae bacterium]|nr:hypothetical protein [Ignavibacteriota bacterium]